MENIIYTKLNYRHPQANDCTWTLDDKTLILTLQPCATSDGTQLYYQQIYVTLDGDDKKYYAEPQINARSVTIQLDKNPTTVYLYGSITPQCVPATTNQYVKLTMVFGSTDKLTVQADDEHDLATIVLHTVDYSDKKADYPITVDNKRSMLITYRVNYKSVDVEVTTTERETITVTNNMTNVDSDAPTKTAVGETLTITITPKTGYTFDGLTTEQLPHLTYDDDLGSRTVNATVTGNKAVITKYVGIGFSNMVLSGGAVAVVNKISVTNNMTNVDSDAPSEIDVGATLNVTITPKDGYTFANMNVQDLPQITYTTKLSGTVTENAIVKGETATISLLTGAGYSNIILSGGAEPKTQTKAITNNLQYVVGEIPSSINVGETLNISVTPQNGYTFTDAASGTLPQLTYENAFGETVSVPFTITGDAATLTFVVQKAYKNITLKGGATPIKPISKNYGTVNVYVVDDDDLDQLAQKRFYTETTSSGSNIVDLGKYIYSIKRIFTHISTIEQGESLKLGKYNCSDITVHQPQEDTVTLTMNVDIDTYGFTNEMYDAETQLFLPFKGLVTIPNSILGMRNVQLIIAINVLSGKGTYTLQYRDATYKYITFYCDDFEPSSDIYFSTENINAIGQLAENDAKAKWGLTPYVLMTYNLPLSYECTTSFPTYLSNHTGYCKFEDVVLNMSFYESNDNKMKLKPTQQDVSEITQQLANGVFMTDI